MQTAIATRQDPPPPPPTKRTGAPTLYREEYCHLVVDYFASRPIPATQSPDNREAVQQTYATMPTFQGFAGSIGVSTKVLYDWQGRHAAFGEACARARDIQEQWFIAGLNTGGINPTGGIFVSKNILKWRDKTEVETVTRVEDSESTTAMKAALQHASPEQLAELSTLVREMLANAPAIEG